MRKSVLFYSVIVIFLATAAITLLGVVGLVQIAEERLDALFYLLLVELIGAVIGLFRATNWFDADHKSSEAPHIEGDWWQVSRAERDNAVAFVSIHGEPRTHSIALDGSAYSADGRFMARFWHVAGSLSEKGELYYFWKGDHASDDDDFSGVGVIRFDASPAAEGAMRGTGWYTTGNLEQGLVTERRKVEYHRAAPGESSVMRQSGEAKAKSATVIAALTRLHPGAAAGPT